jgi:hypothetical protein
VPSCAYRHKRLQKLRQWLELQHGIHAVVQIRKRRASGGPLGLHTTALPPKRSSAAQKALQRIASTYPATAQTKSRWAKLSESTFTHKIATDASVAVRYTKGDPMIFRAVLEAVISSEEKAAVAKQLGSCGGRDSLRAISATHQKAAESGETIAQARKRSMLRLGSQIGHSHYDLARLRASSPAQSALIPPSSLPHL